MGCSAHQLLTAQQREHWYEGLGIRAGIGVASMRSNAGFESPVVRFKAGVSYEYLFTKNWGLETGIYLHTKGGADTETDNGRRIRTTLNLWYLEAPLVCNYHIPVRKFGIVPFAGVYFGHCFKGQAETKALNSSVDWTLHNHGVRYLRRFDAGLRLGCAFTHRHLYLSLGYDLGAIDIAYKYSYEDERKKIPSRWFRYTGTFVTTIGWTF